MGKKLSKPDCEGSSGSSKSESGKSTSSATTAQTTGKYCINHAYYIIIIYIYILFLFCVCHRRIKGRYRK